MTDDNLANLSIRVMRQADLTFAAECTAAEGWVSENKTTLECKKMATSLNGGRHFYLVSPLEEAYEIDGMVSVKDG